MTMFPTREKRYTIARKPAPKAKFQVSEAPGRAALGRIKHFRPRPAPAIVFGNGGSFVARGLTAGSAGGCPGIPDRLYLPLRTAIYAALR